MAGIRRPHPGIFQVLLQTKHFRNSTLGPPLRGAWVALGWPLGHPSVTQSQSQTQRVPILAPLLRVNGRNPSQAEGCNAFPKYQPFANRQLPPAKFSMIRLTSTPEGSRILADFFQRINCELGQYWSQPRCRN